MQATMTFERVKVLALRVVDLNDLWKKGQDRED
jgi:hypothetical protein